MVCGACVFKLALRLVRNHKLDWIHALTRAYNGIERYESGQVKQSRVLKGNPSDYTLLCVPGGSCSCHVTGRPPMQWCTPDLPSACTCVCPDPLPNSHWVSGTCPGEPGYNCGSPTSCPCTCLCPWGDTCAYDCDEGYEWDGEACVSIAVAKKMVGDGLTCVVS